MVIFVAAGSRGLHPLGPVSSALLSGFFTDEGKKKGGYLCVDKEN